MVSSNQATSGFWYCWQTHSSCVLHIHRVEIAIYPCISCIFRIGIYTKWPGVEPYFFIVPTYAAAPDRDQVWLVAEVADHTDHLNAPPLHLRLCPLGQGGAGEEQYYSNSQLGD